MSFHFFPSGYLFFSSNKLTLAKCSIHLQPLQVIFYFHSNEFKDKLKQPRAIKKSPYALLDSGSKNEYQGFLLG